MGVTRRRRKVSVPQQHLDDPDKVGHPRQMVAMVISGAIEALRKTLDRNGRPDTLIISTSSRSSVACRVSRLACS
jgi:hypothetical protein